MYTNLFSDIKTCRVYVCMLEIWNISHFSSQCFGYIAFRISFQKSESFRICYEASPKELKPYYCVTSILYWVKSYKKGWNTDYCKTFGHKPCQILFVFNLRLCPGFVNASHKVIVIHYRKLLVTILYSICKWRRLSLVHKKHINTFFLLCYAFTLQNWSIDLYSNYVFSTIG